MYPPPGNAILDKLRAGVLDAVVHARYVVCLDFDGGNKLTVKAPFRYAERENLLSSKIYDFPLSESKLVRALGHAVTDLECEADGTLELQFSNGDALIVYGNNPRYEAYILLIDGNEYVV
jgi:hypothetical protein